MQSGFGEPQRNIHKERAGHNSSIEEVGEGETDSPMLADRQDPDQQEESDEAHNADVTNQEEDY